MQSIFAATALLAVSAAAQSQPKGSSSVWNAMTFNDEFNTGSDYTANWATDLNGWKGTPPGAFHAPNVQVNFNRLLLKSQWKGSNLENVVDGIDGDCDCGFENIATSMVVSKQRFKYGFFEAKAKGQANTQLMNSFWLQGDHSEINIVEFITSAGKATSDFHCWSDSGTGVTEGSSELDLANLNLADMQTYGVDWQQDSLAFYVNGKVVRTLAKNVFAKDHPECMDESMNIVLSVETSKKHGVPAKSFGTRTFAIDYVRHWGKKAPPATTQAPVKGAKTCAELGWPVANAAKAGFKEVCAHKFEPRSKCKDLKDTATQVVTRDVAMEQCASIGARLCTSAEFKGNVAKQIGCNFAQRKFQWTADQGACDNGQGYVLSWGFNTKKKTDQCVSKDKKAPYRCCAGPVATGAAVETKRAAGGFQADAADAADAADSAPAVQESAGAIESEPNNSGNAEEASSAAVKAATGFGISLLIVAAVVGVALNRRLSAVASAVEAAGQRRGSCVDTEAAGASFDETIDAVSTAGSINSTTDSADEPSDFEENGFVLDQEGASLRIKSVRRGNPAFMNSVYSPEDTVGDATIDEISST